MTKNTCQNVGGTNGESNMPNVSVILDGTELSCAKTTLCQRISSCIDLIHA